MTKFLSIYRGAAVYEIEKFDSAEGEKMDVKIIAKAMTPNLKNMKVDFVQEASTREKALEKVKKDIDRFLDEQNMDQFVIDL